MFNRKNILLIERYLQELKSASVESMHKFTSIDHRHREMDHRLINIDQALVKLIKKLESKMQELHQAISDINDRWIENSTLKIESEQELKNLIKSLNSPGSSCLDLMEKDKRRGNTHHSSKLTELQVKSIREQHTSGASKKNLAPEFGVSINTIDSIVNRRTWKHI